MSVNSDVVHEILLRVDPCSIFHCILVSKDWLQLITGAFFRRDYLTTWKGHPNLLLGFFKYEHLFWRFSQYLHKSPCKSPFMLATSRFGEMMSDRISKQCIGNFISKDAGLMLSADMHRRALYVSNIGSSHGQPLRLPSPPELGNRRVYVASIVSCKEGFKVILARADEVPNHDMHIQTFCSWTGNWDQSKLTLSTNFVLKQSIPEYRCIEIDGMYIEAGMMTDGGVVYWKAKTDSENGIAVYDTANTNNEVSFIPGVADSSGKLDTADHYGLSPQGSLWCAVWKPYYGTLKEHWEKTDVISIWGLDDGKKGWTLIYCLDANLMWMENSTVLAPLSETRPDSPFGFLSFFPQGKSDSIYVELEKKLIFLYHINTNKLERIRYKRGEGLYGFYSYHPLTMQDIDVWPSSPPSPHTACRSWE